MIVFYTGCGILIPTLGCKGHRPPDIAARGLPRFRRVLVQ